MKRRKKMVRLCRNPTPHLQLSGLESAEGCTVGGKLVLDILAFVEIGEWEGIVAGKVGGGDYRKHAGKMFERKY